MDLKDFINFDNKVTVIEDIILFLVVGFLLLVLNNSIHYSSFFAFLPVLPESIKVLAFVLTLLLSFIIVKILWSLRTFLRRNKEYKFTTTDWPQKWIFNGRPELSGSSDLRIRSSRAGMLLKNYFWRNFEMSFELRFENGFWHNVGVLFRAEDLDNYFMMEIEGDPHDYNKIPTQLILKPHIRYKGGWEVMDQSESIPTDFTDFVKVSLEVRDENVYFNIGNKQVFTWILPTHADVNLRDSGKNDNNPPEISKSYFSGKNYQFVQKVPFRLGYGLIGFRAYPGQGALIRGLNVKSL